jgi:DNA-binding LacI/PurR family transcriptional regulator
MVKGYLPCLTGTVCALTPRPEPGTLSRMDGARHRDPAMTDVAELAGVSHQTVSRVLNHHPNVREQTRLRVLAAIQELGYRPNRAAKALATGRTESLGVIAQPSTLYGPASMQSAFGQAATEAGFSVNVASLRALDVASMSAAVDQLLDQQVAGIAVLAPVMIPDAALAAVPDDLPVVLIDADPGQRRSNVRVDQFEGGRTATRHLLDAGHPTVWHVSGPADWFDSRDRLAGWRAVLQAAGAEVPPVIPADWSARAGYQAGQMLARMPEVTAVFAANDHLALGILRALAEHGRRVPDDVSIVGFDDVPEAEYFWPPLTTVRQDFETLARAALELLAGQLRGEPPGQSRTVPVELVVRASTRPPRS